MDTHSGGYRSINECIEALKKLDAFERNTPNPAQFALQESLKIVKPLCYADFVTMTSTKHESITYISRLYCQKATDDSGYHQLFDVPTYQFVSTPHSVEFSRILLDAGGTVQVPGITMSTALTASVKQHKKPTDHDLATIARFSVKIAVDKLEEYKNSSRTSNLSLGYYCVYLHTLALVLNVPLKPVEKLTNIRDIKRAVDEIEIKLKPWLNVLLGTY